MKLRTLAVISLLIFVGIFAVQSPSRSESTQGDQIILYHDLAIDDVHHRIFGSDYANNKVDVLKMGTYEVITSLYLGTHPAGIDIDPDGSELAVAIHSSDAADDGAVVFVNLDTLEESGRLVPTTDGDYRDYRGWAVQYGRPGRLYAVENKGGFGYVSAIDTDTKTEVGHSDYIVREEPSLDISSDSNWLYASQPNWSPNHIFRFDISTDTPTFINRTPHGDAWVEDLCVLNNNIYSSLGQIWSHDLTTLVGSFNGYDSNIECSQVNQAFYTTGEGDNYLRIYKVNNERVQRFVGFPAEAGVIRLNKDESTLFISTAAGIYSMGLQNDQYFYMPLNYSRYCRPKYANGFDSTEISPWPLIGNEYAGTQYLYGEYRLQVRQPALLYSVRAPVCGHEDYGAQVQTHWLDAGTSYGMIFGVTEDWSHYYFFDINTTLQGFRLYYISNGYAYNLVGPAPNAAIYKGTEVNTLTVNYYGNTINLYANGVLLHSMNHNTSAVTGYTHAGVAVISAYDKPSSEAAFDNFVIRQLDASGNPVAVNAPLVNPAQSVTASSPLPSIDADDWPAPDFDNIQLLP